jgi:hypothetical protein
VCHCWRRRKRAVAVEHGTAFSGSPEILNGELWGTAPGRTPVCRKQWHTNLKSDLRKQRRHGLRFDQFARLVEVAGCPNAAAPRS